MSDVKECPSCMTPLGLFTPREANQHINDCLDNALCAANSDERPQPEAIKCAICAKNLHALTPAAREDHVNRCLDSTEAKPRRQQRIKLERHGLVPTRPSVPPDGALKTFLDVLGLGRYGDRFAKEEIDLDALRLLSDDDLTGLKLPEPARRRIGDALRNVRHLRRICGKDETSSTSAHEGNILAGSETQKLPESRLQGAKALQGNAESDIDGDDVLGLYSHPLPTSPIKNEDRDRTCTDSINSFADANQDASSRILPYSDGSQSKDSEERLDIDHRCPFPPNEDSINGDQSKGIDGNNDAHNDVEHNEELDVDERIGRSLDHFNSPSLRVSPSPFSSPEVLRGDNESPPAAGMAALSFGTTESSYEGNNEKKVRFGKSRHQTCGDCGCSMDGDVRGRHVDMEYDETWYRESIEQENRRHKRKLEEIETKYREFKLRKLEKSEEAIDLTGDDDDPESQPKQATVKRKKHAVLSTGVSPAVKKDRRTRTSAITTASQGKTNVQTQIQWKATKARILADSDSDSDETPFSQRVARSVSRKRGGTVTAKDLHKLMGIDKDDDVDDGKVSEEELFMDLTQSERQGQEIRAATEDRKEVDESEEYYMDLSQTAAPGTLPSAAPSVLNGDKDSDNAGTEEFMDLTQTQSQSQSTSGTAKGKKKVSRLKKMKKCTEADIRKAIRGDEALYEMILECRTVGFDHIMTIVKEELEGQNIRVSLKAVEDFVTEEGISTRASAKGSKASSTLYFQELSIAEMRGSKP